MDSGKTENVSYMPAVTLEGDFVLHQIIQKGEAEAGIPALPATLVDSLLAEGHEVLFSVAVKASQTADTLAEFIDKLAECLAKRGVVGTKSVCNNAPACQPMLHTCPCQGSIEGYLIPCLYLF